MDSEVGLDDGMCDVVQDIVERTELLAIHTADAVRILQDPRVAILHHMHEEIVGIRNSDADRLEVVTHLIVQEPFVHIPSPENVTKQDFPQPEIVDVFQDHALWEVIDQVEEGPNEVFRLLVELIARNSNLDATPYEVHTWIPVRAPATRFADHPVLHWIILTIDIVFRPEVRIDTVVLLECFGHSILAEQVVRQRGLHLDRWLQFLHVRCLVINRRPNKLHRTVAVIDFVDIVHAPENQFNTQQLCKYVVVVGRDHDVLQHRADRKARTSDGR
jgi:hypothetical protein